MKNLVKSAALAAGLLFSTQLVNAQQKIGHINFGDIISGTTEFKAAQDQLKTLNDSKTKELQGMYAEYQKKQTDANEKMRNRSEANKETVDAELNTLGTQLRDIETRINEVQRLAQEEVGKKQEELYQPIERKVMTAVNDIAKAKGYAYVFDISSTNIPYFAGGDDLTTEVKSKLGISATAAPAATTPAKK
ncbi:outer membrane protein [Sphingobacterium spiritivorum ATCC 33300]|uniref:Outer membrane protein n=1 Tax=Sphingobacterium spiritivorum ATCC 33300 TaxID=525372 RepID=C2G5H6_SPHSI|nr:OmpH family outer membrane protein [Sphingobacterium spiritivorum]EEI89542.1 outer membrane protein [Sphingobacterium spiritivorum ATCC 33300]QQS94573.1 OmpH family outer membrane protein [Sphingobacterium spiritivorum]